MKNLELKKKVSFFKFIPTVNVQNELKRKIFHNKSLFCATCVDTMYK